MYLSNVVTPHAIIKQSVATMMRRLPLLFCLAAVAVTGIQLPAKGVRINKIFTSSFSRREADRLVSSGRVRINGARASPGDRVGPSDLITLDERPFAQPAVEERGTEERTTDIYLKYWKPRGVTCTTDQRVRGNIIEALAFPGPERLFPVGRLDKDSEGLILLTNDGRLPNAINRAEHAHEKIYEVTCHRALSDAHLRQLARGVVITTTAQRDRGPPKELTAPTLPCAVARTSSTSFNIVLTEGRNRQIRRMCQAIGFTVTALRRTEVMGIGLTGLQGPGEWTMLPESERSGIHAAIEGAAVRAEERDATTPPRPRARKEAGSGKRASRPAESHADTWGRWRGNDNPRESDAERRAPSAASGLRRDPKAFRKGVTRQSLEAGRFGRKAKARRH